MADDEQLGTYLNDHLAGSTAGLDLARRIGAQAEGTPLGEFMATLVAEIEADQKTLEDLIESLSVERQPLKQAATWMLEKVARLRLNPAVLGSKELALLIQLETLWMGVQGKRSLWESLAELAGRDARLAPLDTARLIERATEQAHGLEVQRRALAPLALASSA